jgi:hypothetical protein
MKKLTLIAAIFFSVLCFKQADAQLSISINIGTQPAWGPTGYDHVDYYYLPDIDCYYYVPGNQFIYLSGGRWIRSSSLPPQYGNYDLYSGYKVVVNQPKPYLQDNTFRTKYASYKGHRGQAVIRDSHDPKYKSSNRPGNNRPQAKPNRPGDNNRPQAKPQPAPSHAKQGNSHGPAEKPQSKPSHGADKEHKDDHHQ